MSAAEKIVSLAIVRQGREQIEKGGRMQGGFTAIPNGVLRGAKGRLKGLHLVALMAVIEKTIAFNKDRDEISDSQVGKEWNCDRERVGEAVTDLINAGIFLCHGNGRYGRILSIADPEKWGELTSRKKPQEGRQKAAVHAAKSRKESGKKPHSKDNYQQTVKANNPLPPVDPPKRKTSRAAAKQKFDPQQVELPAGLSADTWAKWVQHRSESGKKLTQTSTQQQLVKLADWYAEGHSPDRIVLNAIEKSWQGLYLPNDYSASMSQKPTAAQQKATSARSLFADQSHGEFQDDRTIDGEFHVL